VLIPLLLLVVYEKVNISSLTDELAQIQSQISKVESERQGYGSQAPRVEKFTAMQKKIEDELETIHSLAKFRLQDVKALDSLQSLLPAQTWLKKVTIQGTTVRIEGYTSAEEGVSELIRLLSDSAFFSSIEPKSTTQEELATGSVKRFEIEFKVGK
jgi:Tfp pilus assembly protein PilN